MVGVTLEPSGQFAYLYPCRDHLKSPTVPPVFSDPAGWFSPEATRPSRFPASFCDRFPQAVGGGTPEEEFARAILRALFSCAAATNAGRLTRLMPGVMDIGRRVNTLLHAAA